MIGTTVKEVASDIRAAKIINDPLLLVRVIDQVVISLGLLTAGIILITKDLPEYGMGLIGTVAGYWIR